MMNELPSLILLLLVLGVVVGPVQAQLDAILPSQTTLGATTTSASTTTGTSTGTAATATIATTTTTTGTSSTSTSDAPVALLLAKNYRGYLSNNSTRLCSTGCDDNNPDCLVSYGFLPAGICLSAYIRNQSSMFVVLSDGSEAVCQRLYEDRDCQTLNTNFILQDAENQCHYRWDRNGTNQCNRATQYTVLDNFCIPASKPIHNYTVPMVETQNYPTLEMCESRTEGGVGNAFRMNQPNLCQPTVNTLRDFSKQVGSMKQQCKGNRLETTYYMDTSCSVVNETQLALPTLAHGGCLEHPLWPTVRLATNGCATPTQYYCQDLSQHELTKDVFKEISAQEQPPSPKEEERAMDLYVRANWYNVKDDTNNHTMCSNCTETNGCLQSFGFVLESKCNTQINQDGSSRYYTLGNGQVCRLKYEDRDCTQEAYLENAVEDGCNFLTTPDTCDAGNDEEGGDSPSVTTLLQNHCIYSTQPRGSFVQPMVTVRIYPTLDDCKNSTDTYGEYLTIPDATSCRESAVENMAGDKIPGSVRFSCNPADDSNIEAATLERFANKQCSINGQEILASPTQSYSSGGVCNPNQDTTTATNNVIRTFDCDAPKIYCKENTLLNNAVPYFEAKTITTNSDSNEDGGEEDEEDRINRNPNIQAMQRNADVGLF